MYFASYIISLQCFTQSFLTGPLIGHSRDKYVNAWTLLLWLAVLCLAAMDDRAGSKQKVWDCSNDNISCPKAGWALSLCISVQALHVWEMPLPLTYVRCCCLLLPREYGIPCFCQWQTPVFSFAQSNSRNASWSHCYEQADQWPPVCFFPPKSLWTNRAPW